MTNKDTSPDRKARQVVVLISADAEWDVTRSPLLRQWPDMKPLTTPYGEALEGEVTYAAGASPVVWMHGGWGKIAAAASAQYALSRWRPQLVVNLGTCGGFEGEVARETVILATRTQVYDIVEQMGDPSAALAHYTTDLDLAWLREPYPMDIRRGLLLSGDRDLVPEDIPYLRDDLGGTVVDWESASIAYVADRNDVRCLILRGVTDLVGPGGGEAYDGTVTFFRQQARRVMTRLLDALPAWLDRVVWET